MAPTEDASKAQTLQFTMTESRSGLDSHIVIIPLYCQQEAGGDGKAKKEKKLRPTALQGHGLAQSYEAEKRAWDDDKGVESL